MGDLQVLNLLKLEHNQFSAAIPASFSRLNTKQIHVQDNLLTAIPTEIGLMNTSMNLLNLGDNAISVLPSELFLLTSLNNLQLYGNKFSSLPSVIGQMENLDICMEQFSINDNRVASIPSEIGLLDYFGNWNFANNSIQSFPDVDWSILFLRKIDLSWNALIGTIPTQLGLIGLGMFGDFHSLALGNNQLRGTVPTELGLLMDGLEILDISFNSLTGSVPSEFGGNMSAPLRFMDLQGNNFTGVLPFELCEWLCHTRECAAYGSASNSSSLWGPCDSGILLVDCSFLDCEGCDCPEAFGSNNTSSR